MDVLLSDDPFDREFSLSDLLSGISTDRLIRILAESLGDFCICDPKGAVVLMQGTVALHDPEIELILDIEPLGSLKANVGSSILKTSAEFLEVLLLSQKRYQMAARLHEEQVSHDYQRLQQEHAALLQSEQKYRALSLELETRVQNQIETLKIAERQLYQAEKLAAVGQLAAGVAHEINNPLGFIRSNLNSASAYLKKISDLRPAIESNKLQLIEDAWQNAEMDFLLEDFEDLLRESIAGADRVAHIVTDLKGFSSVDRPTKEHIDLNESIRTVCNIAGNRIQQKAQLNLELQKLPLFLCQPGQINELILAMVLNSLQAIEQGGSIRIATMVEGLNIRVDITDNGCGISQDNLSRIFDPFFTTRDVGSGIGLGLTISRDIVQAHGGWIDVESVVGQGTTFSINFPFKEG